MLLTEPDFTTLNYFQCLAEFVNIQFGGDNAEHTVKEEQAREFTVARPLIKIDELRINVASLQLEDIVSRSEQNNVRVSYRRSETMVSQKRFWKFVGDETLDPFGENLVVDADLYLHTDLAPRFVKL
jgi:hypothetical protein